jgi:two-component sensor histidine kinase
VIGDFEVGKPFDIEYRIRDAQGNWLWLKDRSIGRAVGEGEVLIEGLATDITERRQADQALRTSLVEKETLLKEIHHRVKNNLASIIGLINLQQDQLTDPAVLNEFSELGGRIHSMALIHELLYRSETLSRINLNDYFEKLAAHLRDSYTSSGLIHLRVAAVGVEMDLDNAIPCGLIVNELVTNTYKYAFPGGRPAPGQAECQITIAAAWEEGAYTLSVSDNGVGLPANLDWQTSKSLGLQLVMLLGQHQLRGQVELDRSTGTSFYLRFVPKVNQMK